MSDTDTPTSTVAAHDIHVGEAYRYTTPLAETDPMCGH